jgi:hypothetical protein
MMDYLVAVMTSTESPGFGNRHFTELMGCTGQKLVRESRFGTPTGPSEYLRLQQEEEIKIR